MRGDSGPQLNHLIDILLDLLARVPGSCAAVARLIAHVVNRTNSLTSFRRTALPTSAGMQRENEKNSHHGAPMLLR
jgi:hypothetical protein